MSILNSLTKTHCPNGLKCENRCGVSTCPRSTQPPYQYTYFQPSPRIVCFDSQCRSLAHIQVSKSRDHEAPPAQSCDLSIQYHVLTSYLRHRLAGHPNKETNKQPKRGRNTKQGDQRQTKTKTRTRRANRQIMLYSTEEPSVRQIALQPVARCESAPEATCEHYLYLLDCPGSRGAPKCILTRAVS